MSKIYQYIQRLVSIIMTTMLIVMVGSIFINVIARYFGMAFSWIDEVSRLTFVWMSFMAIAVGLQEGLHPSFNVLFEKIRNTTLKKMLLSIINIFILFFLFYTLKGGIDYISKVYVQKTSILGISVAYKYAAVPFALGVMVIETIRKLIIIWKNIDTE